MSGSSKRDDGSSGETLATRLIHHPYQPPAGWRAMPVPVAKASTVLFRDTADLHQYKPRDGKSYRYGLHGTPTSYTLAARIASLEGAEHCLLTPSGLSAITLVSLALLRPGDEVLLPDNVYGQNRHLTEHMLPGFGISHRFYDPLDLPAWQAAVEEYARPDSRQRAAQRVNLGAQANEAGRHLADRRSERGR